MVGVEGTFRDGLQSTNNRNCPPADLSPSPFAPAAHVTFPSRAFVQPVTRLSPKIDVLVLYSDRALTDFDYSENGLVDRIYEAFEETNDAMDKSEIALDINVVHVQKVRAGVEMARHHGPWGWWL